MDPPYQRRSVWTQQYKDYFIDTVLNGYPAPAIFLFRVTTPDGVSKYSVVDGKQRLSTLFEFASDNFPVYEKGTIARFRGKYFKDLPDKTRTDFWSYMFAVEYLTSDNEDIINNIFDRINRNVAKLTRQELRHAQLSGEFISEVAVLSDWMFKRLPLGVPNISTLSRKQMKDDEFVSQLLLLIEEGVRSYSQDDLDEAFAQRDENWENKETTTARFQEIIDHLVKWAKNDKGFAVLKSRLRYQADFFSLFGALNDLISANRLQQITNPIPKLESFVNIIDDPSMREKLKWANNYYAAARSATNDAGPRRTRIDTIVDVLLGDIKV